MKKTELLKLAIIAVVDSESLYTGQKLQVIEMLLTEISTQKLVEDYREEGKA
jgi:hypothetical protein